MEKMRASSPLSGAFAPAAGTAAARFGTERHRIRAPPGSVPFSQARRYLSAGVAAPAAPANAKRLPGREPFFATGKRLRRQAGPVQTETRGGDRQFNRRWR